MRNEDPPRLKSTTGSSPELARALEALGQGHSDHARIARVEQKLGALLDAAPSSSHAGWLQHALFESVTGKFLVATLLAALGTGWYLHAKQTETVALAPRVTGPAASAAAPSNDAHLEPQEPSAHTLPATQRSQAPALEEGAPHHSAPRSKPRASKPVTSRSPGPASSRLHSAAPPLRATSARSGATDAQEVEAAESRAEPLAVPPRLAAPEPAPPPDILPREATLLLSAREELQTNPSSALALLEQHMARFPNGMLAPEREVLAIRALRKLGRSAEAEQRLARLRAQYPSTPHLRGLR